MTSILSHSPRSLPSASWDCFFQTSNPVYLLHWTHNHLYSTPLCPNLPGQSKFYIRMLFINFSSMYSLFTHDYVPVYGSNAIIKFADDKTVIGLVGYKKIQDWARWKFQTSSLTLTIRKDSNWSPKDSLETPCNVVYSFTGDRPELTSGCELTSNFCLHYISKNHLIFWQYIMVSFLVYHATGHFLLESAVFPNKCLVGTQLRFLAHLPWSGGRITN